MTLPRYRSGASAMGRFPYREVHHEAALRALRTSIASTYQLSLELAQFPLEVLLRGVGEVGPVALCAGDGHLITHTNGAAASQGVRPGMSLRVAQAFCPDLAGLNRNLAAEHQALAELVHFLALGRHHCEHPSLESRAEVSTKPFTLQVSGHLPPGQVDPGPMLKRDLRALGYRGTVSHAAPFARGPLRAQRDAGLRGAGAVPGGGEWGSHLHLPWTITKRHDLNFALQRLEADLGLAAQAAGQDVSWLQVCLVSERGGRMHHGVEHIPAGAWRRAMSELRACVHRESALRVSALELRAGLAGRILPAGMRPSTVLQ
ncbi:MAG: impB/mucB/samB family [Pseudomonadota bacterium]